MVKEITVSYSELMSARRCDFKHQLAYVEGWGREHGPESALTFGTAWHAVLNEYYDTLHKIMRGGEWSKQPSPWRAARETIGYQPEEIRPNLRWMLEGYSAHYGVEPGWHVVATEKKLIVPLPQLSRSLRINLKVYIDLVIYDFKNKTLWVDDHKTCAQLPNQKQMTDPQLPLYMYALRTSGEYNASHGKVFGARYSYALKPPKTMQFRKERTLDDRFRRRLVSHTDREVQNVAEDAYRTIYNRYTNQKRWGDKQPRSFQPDCSWCDFNVACHASRKGYRVREFLTDQGMGRWRDADKLPTEVTE